MSVATRSRRTILTVYDLLHLFVLEGPKLRRSVVVDYLARAGMNPRTTDIKSRLRGFERLKAHLRRLGIAFHHEIEQRGSQPEAFMVIPEPEQALAFVSGLLDQEAPATPVPALDSESSG